jgi:hypothetical protein
MGVECGACVDGNNSLTQDFTGPVIRVDCQGCHNYDNGAVLIELQGNEAPTQDGPPRSLPVGVLPIRVGVGVSYVAPTSPIFVPKLKR